MPSIPNLITRHKPSRLVRNSCRPRLAAAHTHGSRLHHPHKCLPTRGDTVHLEIVLVGHENDILLKPYLWVKYRAKTRHNPTKYSQLFRPIGCVAPPPLFSHATKPIAINSTINHKDECLSYTIFLSLTKAQRYIKYSIVRHFLIRFSVLAENIGTFRNNDTLFLITFADMFSCTTECTLKPKPYEYELRRQID